MSYIAYRRINAAKGQDRQSWVNVAITLLIVEVMKCKQGSGRLFTAQGQLVPVCAKHSDLFQSIS